jgi:putative zinc finger/helix-turn-helix YgiT family protein
MFKKLREITTECPICETERTLSFGKRNEIVKVGGEEIKIETLTYFCPVGKHYFYDLEDEEKKYQDAYRAYRERKCLLQPEEIKQIREKYGLSQRAFARLLGWSALTLHRYETGAIQDNVHNDLLSILKDTYSFKSYFQSKRVKLPEKIVAKIESNLEEIGKKENQLEFNYMLKHSPMRNIELLKAVKLTTVPLKKLWKIFETTEESKLGNSIRIIAHRGICEWKVTTTKSANVEINSLYGKKGGLALAA